MLLGYMPDAQLLYDLSIPKNSGGGPVMKKKLRKIITSVVVFSFMLTGSACSLKEISIENPENKSNLQEEHTPAQEIQSSTLTPAVTDGTLTDTPSQTYPMVARPVIGETFPVTSLAKSGTILATVHNAQVYTNLYEAGVAWEETFYDFRAQTDGTGPLQADFFDRQSGDFLESAEFGKTAFVVVELTLENHSAVSRATELNVPGTPKVYEDDTFRIDTLNIAPMKESNAESPGNIGNIFPLTWCSMANTHPEIHPYAVTIPEGESVTIKIGTMVQQTVYDEATKSNFGGQIGDDLLSRLYLATSMSTRTSMVYLELDASSLYQ